MGVMPADLRGRGAVANGGMLNSWKEIANYTGRGVRTVQRWEAKFGFPVHRLYHSPRSPVVAFAAELDAWLTTSALNSGSERPSFVDGLRRMEPVLNRHFASISQLKDSASSLRNSIALVRMQRAELWKQNRELRTELHTEASAVLNASLELLKSVRPRERERRSSAI